MITINFASKDELDVKNAIVKVQDWLGENGKWVFGWSQETKGIVLGPKNRIKVNMTESSSRYEQGIRGSGQNFFNFMNWSKTQGDESPFVAFEDRLADAVNYASATDLAIDAHNLESSHFEILALRIDRLLQKAGTSVAKYREDRDESIGILYAYANQMFQKLIGKGNVEENLVAFFSEQDKTCFFVDGIRPQWYMFSTGKNSFAGNLAASLGFNLNELQNDKIQNRINISALHNLPQLANEAIMAIKIGLPVASALPSEFSCNADMSPVVVDKNTQITGVVIPSQKGEMS